LCDEPIRTTLPATETGVSAMSDQPKHPKEENKTPPKKPNEKLHRPEATLDEAPAGSPNAEERSRLSD
jgi:hypothetical protein